MLNFGSKQSHYINMCKIFVYIYLYKKLLPTGADITKVSLDNPISAKSNQSNVNL